MAVGGRQEGGVLVPVGITVAVAVSIAVPFSVPLSSSVLVFLPVLVLVPVSVPVPVSVSVSISVPFPVSVLLSIAVSISVSVLAFRFGSVRFLARAVVGGVDIGIAISRGRHDGPCQGKAPALETGKWCGRGCNNRADTHSYTRTRTHSGGCGAGGKPARCWSAPVIAGTNQSAVRSICSGKASAWDPGRGSFETPPRWCVCVCNLMQKRPLVLFWETRHKMADTKVKDQMGAWKSFG